MGVLDSLQPVRVFKYFEEICNLPHGSGNMDKIAMYCMDFAKKQGLKAVRDRANNVIIFKDGTNGYENSEPVILQGHLDMVCQKTEQSAIDFEKEGLSLYVEGDYIKAKGTTLGGDNGIAVAMILALLESDDLCHPPIEAVFTTDEEIGMCGAIDLDGSVLSAKTMINLDSEEEGILTVSCAGGSDFRMTVDASTLPKSGYGIEVTIKGLKGGHSGVEIASGRENSNILAGRLLNSGVDFDLVSVNGGDKGNAIPLCTKIVVCVQNEAEFISKAKSCLENIKAEISAKEPGFTYEINCLGQGSYEVLKYGKQIVFALACMPNGVQNMSFEIEGLVETSLNLGIVKTDKEGVLLHFSLRSNKKTALSYLEQKLEAFAGYIPCSISKSGHYPPWEFKENSRLQQVYKSTFEQMYGKKPIVQAIHAGLECGVFCDKIEGLDCISIGPEMHDIHTVYERLSISSTERLYKLLLEMLKQYK